MWPFKKKTEDYSWLRLQNIVPPRGQEDFTPDFLWLERHEWCLLFVYCEMMHTRKLYNLIGDESVNLGKAFTATEDWVMWKKKLGEETFPIALKSGIGIHRRIKGEIHAVRPHIFWNYLDKRFLNGIEFRRERVQVLVPYHVQEQGVTIDHNEFIHKLRVHMYVGVPDYWNSQLDAGYLYAPVKAFDPKVKWVDGHQMNSYYYYSRLEDETNV